VPGHLTRKPNRDDINGVSLMYFWNFLFLCWRPL
jgi:hypothetical protein